MSYGLVVCSECSREVHQGTNRVWFHCGDMKPICENGQAVFPRSADDISGPFCGADDLDHEYKAERDRRRAEAGRR